VGNFCGSGGHAASEVNRGGVFISATWAVVSAGMSRNLYAASGKANLIPYEFKYGNDYGEDIGILNHNIIMEEYAKFLKDIIPLCDYIAFLSTCAASNAKELLGEKFLRDKIQEGTLISLPNDDKATKLEQLFAKHPEIFHNKEYQNQHYESYCATNDAYYSLLRGAIGEGSTPPCTVFNELYQDVATSPIFQIILAEAELLKQDWASWSLGRFDEISISGRRTISRCGLLKPPEGYKSWGEYNGEPQTAIAQEVERRMKDAKPGTSKIDIAKGLAPCEGEYSKEDIERYIKHCEAGKEYWDDPDKNNPSKTNREMAKEAMDLPSKKNPSKTNRQLAGKGGETTRDRCEVDPELAKTVRDGNIKGGTNSHSEEKDLKRYIDREKIRMHKFLQEGKEVDLIQCVYKPKAGKIGCSSKNWRVATKRKNNNDLRFRLSCSECGIVSGSTQLAQYAHMKWKSHGILRTKEQINIAFEEMLKKSSLEKVIIRLRKHGF
jgi:hypothetical protein